MYFVNGLNRDCALKLLSHTTKKMIETMETKKLENKIRITIRRIKQNITIFSIQAIHVRLYVMESFYIVANKKIGF